VNRRFSDMTIWNRLIIDGNAVYEIDDECMKQKERNERRRNQNYKSGRCSLGARPAKGTGER
jgi:hypothetical protein